MAGALGVNQRWLFHRRIRARLAFSPASAARWPVAARRPASLGIDLAAISDAFVVVVVGGLGSIPGAFLAALLIAEVKAFCIGLGYSKITLGIEFIVMALILVMRPWGAARGDPIAIQRTGACRGRRCRSSPRRGWLAFGAALVALAVAPATCGRLQPDPA